MDSCDYIPVSSIIINSFKDVLWKIDATLFVIKHLVCLNDTEPNFDCPECRRSCSKKQHIDNHRKNLKEHMIRKKLDIGSTE